MVQGTDEEGYLSHFRRSITKLTFEFDYNSYQATLKNSETMKQITRFNDFLNTKLSRSTAIELVIDDINLDCKNPESMTEVMPLLIPTKCKFVTFKRVYVKMNGAMINELKMLFRIQSPLEILRFEHLRTDDVPKFLKSSISRDSDI